MTPDLVVLGNLLVDDVVFPDGRTRFAEAGGACLYLALAAALWGVRVGVVSVAGEEYPARALEGLQARGVDLAGVRRLKTPGLRTWLLYEDSRRRVVHRLDGPAHADVSPEADDVPLAWRSAPAIHLAPMPLDTQARLVAAMAGWSGVRLSLDPYALVTPDTRDAVARVFASVDTLFLSEDELLLGEGEGRAALTDLRRGRLRRVVYKRGPRGGICLDGDGFLEWAPRANAVVDPTGAGDAFAAGVWAGWLRGEPTPRALARGVVSASFAIEAWGADGLLAATPDVADRRLREWFA